VLKPAFYRAAVDMSGTTPGHLARCHGFTVAAGGRLVGSVETPIFSGPDFQPDYLIVRIDGAIARESVRAVPVAFVDEVDPDRRVVVLTIDGRAVNDLPGELPLTDRGPPADGRSPFESLPKPGAGCEHAGTLVRTASGPDDAAGAPSGRHSRTRRRDTA
jgi:hypothetical protein